MIFLHKVLLIMNDLKLPDFGCLKLPDFGSDNKPDLPLHLNFPKREFGKAKIVKRAFQAQWFGKWRWIHYDRCRDLAFCNTCITALKTGKMSVSKGNVKDLAFLYTGFSNWKDTTVAFGSHEKSATHKIAVETVITLPRTTRDVGELISSAHAAEKLKSRQCLVIITESICFLTRQGIALCGDGDKSLRIRAIDQPQLLTWLEHKTDKYTSPQIQNEILTVLATNILRNITETIQKASYFSIMADEVTDSSNKEQVVICFRIVDEHFEAHEEFIGLYQVDSIVS